jgi:HD superfamily phosphohydrolase
MAHTITDNIWGDWTLDSYYFKFIDTYEFQRMRNMKQLGSTFFVFESACGTRFNHSLGVGYLANYFGNLLRSKFPKTVTTNHVKLLTVAGLLHDIGHGPFSHTFDKLFDKDYNHEIRSRNILALMCEKYNLGLSQSDIIIIGYMFDPPEDKKEFWLYQIISGEIDVDRMDYVLRDSFHLGMNVSFTREDAYSVIGSAYIDKNSTLHFKKAKTFVDSRLFLYNNIYLHPKCVSIDKIIVDMLREANIHTLAMDTNSFLKLDDTIIFQLYHDKTISSMVDRIIGRDF